MKLRKILENSRKYLYFCRTLNKAMRLYREALKQSIMDPKTGAIDISILTTGVSAYAREQQAKLKTALKQLIEREVRSATVKARDLIEIWRRHSDESITNQQFDIAVQASVPQQNFEKKTLKKNFEN